MLNFYQHLPQHIDPIAFTVGSFSIRWYAITYLIGFGVIYWLLIYRIKKGELKISIRQPAISNQENKNKKYGALYPAYCMLVIDYMLIAFFSSLIGGRIGYVLFYNFSYFISHPISIVSPFENGQFIGIYGMSYHGALIGILLGSYIFLRIKKINFWEWADFVISVVPLGYFFGRVGNFLNGELYGRLTNSSLGMYFTNSLRYPSQLLEAFLEGLVLFVVLWSIRNKKLPAGTLLAVYLLGYGFFRIFSEIFREPDPQIGFIWGYFTLGQLFSLVMIIIGIALFLKKRKI